MHLECAVVHRRCLRRLVWPHRARHARSPAASSSPTQPTWTRDGSSPYCWPPSPASYPTLESHYRSAREREGRGGGHEMDESDTQTNTLAHSRLTRMCHCCCAVSRSCIISVLQPPMPSAWATNPAAEVTTVRITPKDGCGEWGWGWCSSARWPTSPRSASARSRWSRPSAHSRS